MKHAEQSSSRPKKSYTWSPVLRNAGLEYRYWSLRLKEAINPTLDFSVTIQKIQNQIAEKDPSYRLPLRKASLSKEAILLHKKAGYMMPYARSNSLFCIFVILEKLKVSDADSCVF